MPIKMLWLTLLLPVSIVAPAVAQELKPFVDTHYYDPLRAEPHAARIKILIPAWSKEFPDSLESGTRFAWQITLGRELPILAFGDQLDTGRVGAKKFGAALAIPISFHVVEDFKDPSAPIVDTDYQFGFMAKLQYGIRDDLWFGARIVPWSHESTHLGDEYVLVASRNPAFERINVSYEWFEYGVSLESESFTIRHGGRKPHGDEGYYSDHLLGSDEPTLTPSEKNFEPSFGFEYRFPLAGKRHVYASADLRNRLQYDYHRLPGAEDQRQWSMNLQLGRTLPEDSRGSPLQDYFVEFYYGVNPYGQLRSQRDYWSAGIGWVFGF
jgi:Protein of unknown function (DUF1207)